MFELGATKSPGPKGFNGLFFQSYWGIIGPDVISAVMSFFSSGIMPPTLNSTDIILIPKVKGPEVMAHFHPISLCNFAYKIVSKVLVNRLKSFLDELITVEQSAFI